MQRWQAESARDQPYHSIQAFKVEESRGGGGKKTQSRGSSVEYLDPREKRGWAWVLELGEGKGERVTEGRKGK